MTTYRIKRITRKNGEDIYYPQIRCFLFFWKYIYKYHLIEYFVSYKNCDEWIKKEEGKKASYVTIIDR